MQVQVTKKEPTFEPIEIKLLLESKEELATFALLSFTGSNHINAFRGVFGNIKLQSESNYTEVTTRMVANFLDKMFATPDFSKHIADVDFQA